MREIGIRIALGASARNVAGLVLRQGLALALAGVAIGAAVAFALTRWMESLIFGVSPTDPVTFSAVSAVLVVIAMLASYVPARRAVRVDPMRSLRVE
jgi:putative ABC transport system permease protein